MSEQPEFDHDVKTRRSGKWRRYQLAMISLCVLVIISISCNINNPFVILTIKHIIGPEFLSFITNTGKPQELFVFHEFVPEEDTTLSPTNVGGSSKLSKSTKVGLVEVEGSVDLSQLEANGYLAIKVPHAPPTFTVSSMMTPTVQFIYRTIPTGTQITEMITITRRNEYTPTVNEAMPIADGQSHWETWWLPDGNTFPLPTEAFEIRRADLPFQIRYTIDFGDGTHSRSCQGCVLEYYLYNGFNFIGPLKFPILIDGAGGPSQEPMAIFDHCKQGLGFETSFIPITPTIPYTHEHCLTNRDTMTRTFALEFSSSEDRSYTIFTQAEGGSITPLMGNEVEVPPNGLSNFSKTGVRIMAVHTPTITISDTTREIFTIKATSKVSPEVIAEAVSMAFGPQYILNEALNSGNISVYLPAVLKP